MNFNKIIVLIIWDNMLDSLLILIYLNLMVL